MKRCKWCNENNPLYVEYHDKEWCIPNYDDNYLFEMLILESFQAGLSWECVLNKRNDFRTSYDNFNIDKIINYDENKINELFSKEEPEQINKKKNKHHIEELFGYTYNTITTDNSIDKKEKQLKPKFRKKKKRRR